MVGAHASRKQQRLIYTYTCPEARSAYTCNLPCVFDDHHVLPPQKLFAWRHVAVYPAPLVVLSLLLSRASGKRRRGFRVFIRSQQNNFESPPYIGSAPSIHRRLDAKAMTYTTAADSLTRREVCSGCRSSIQTRLTHTISISPVTIGPPQANQNPYSLIPPPAVATLPACLPVCLYASASASYLSLSPISSCSTKQADARRPAHGSRRDRGRADHDRTVPHRRPAQGGDVRGGHRGGRRV